MPAMLVFLIFSASASNSESETGQDINHVTEGGYVEQKTKDFVLAYEPYIFTFGIETNEENENEFGKILEETGDLSLGAPPFGEPWNPEYNNLFSTIQNEDVEHDGFLGHHGDRRYLHVHVAKKIQLEPQKMIFAIEEFFNIFNKECSRYKRPPVPKDRIEKFVQAVQSTMDGTEPVDKEFLKKAELYKDVYFREKKFITKKDVEDKDNEYWSTERRM